MTIHLLGRGDLLTECGLTEARRDELTPDLETFTCRDCRTALIKQGMCSNCGEKTLSWGTRPMRDVKTIFYLACDYCSETLIPLVDAETVAAFLTAQKWTP